MKTIAILGDSYSTYENYIPDDYFFWYSDSKNSEPNNINNVSQTWWWQLCSEKNFSLIANCSSSGSTICNTGYNGMDASETSFIHRMKRELGENRKKNISPDIIFVFGGTNDFWANSPTGIPIFSGWQLDNLNEFAPAFCYMIDYLKKWNPNSLIYNIINDDISHSMRNLISKLCKYYKINNIILQNIEKENGHPNVNGMIQIKNQIAKHLEM